MCYLIQPIKPPIQFLFVGTNHAVWLTSVYGSPQTTLPLALLRGVTPAHQGLAPLGLSFTIFKRTITKFTIQGTHTLINNCRIVVNSRVVARIKFSITGQGSNPQSATIHSATRQQQAEKITTRRTFYCNLTISD